MTLHNLKTALKSRDSLKRSRAIDAFKQTDFGLEALPLLRKAIDDDDISVILTAIECIGKLGPQALAGESPDRPTPKGLAAKLLSLGNRLWSYSGYKNCYGTALRTLLSLGYTTPALFTYIRKNLDLEYEGDFVESLAALRAIGSPEALDLMKHAAEARLPELNKAYTKKVHAVLAKAGVTIAPAKSETKDWHPFHTLQIKGGKLWAGDAQLANADDGFIATVPAGNYIVECDGLPRRCKAVSKLRVRLESAADVKRGKKLGETGTDSATIGVCEIAAFEAAYEKKGGADAVQKAIDSQSDGFGVIKVSKFPDAIMPFVPTGSDGTGPVFALMAGKKCVGIELAFE